MAEFHGAQASRLWQQDSQEAFSPITDAADAAAPPEYSTHAFFSSLSGLRGRGTGDDRRLDLERRGGWRCRSRRRSARAWRGRGRAGGGFRFVRVLGILFRACSGQPGGGGILLLDVGFVIGAVTRDGDRCAHGDASEEQWSK